MWFSEVFGPVFPNARQVNERRTATPSEALLAVSRLLGEVAASESASAVRSALVREARALFGVDGAVLLGVEMQSGTVTVLDADPPTADEHPLVPRPLGALPAVRDLLAGGVRSAQPAAADANVSELVGWPSHPRTTLIVAVRDGVEVRHVLALVAGRDEPCGDDEQSLAASFGSAAAGALAQVHLAEEHERRITQLSALARAARTV